MTKSNRGFAGMDEQRQREIASKGGKVAHQRGTAHEFNSEEAHRAGQRGGEVVSRDRQHMAEIGARGGRASHGAKQQGQDGAKEGNGERPAAGAARGQKGEEVAARGRQPVPDSDATVGSGRAGAHEQDVDEAGEGRGEERAQDAHDANVDATFGSEEPHREPSIVPAAQTTTADQTHREGGQERDDRDDENRTANRGGPNQQGETRQAGSAKRGHKDEEVERNRGNTRR